LAPLGGINDSVGVGIGNGPAAAFCLKSKIKNSKLKNALSLAAQAAIYFLCAAFCSGLPCVFA
jgi:hypothetical protein